MLERTRRSISRPTMSEARDRGVTSRADGRDRLASAKNGDAVGDRLDLVELVRDDDHRLPSSAIIRSVSKSASASCGVSTAVGSSRTRTRDPRKTALRISTRCCSPTESCQIAMVLPFTSSVEVFVIWQLSIGEQQRVEILKALYREARVLIMDEPTAVLTPQEAETLFETLRTMADEGKTVIFISHKLYEVKAVADRVTVLRGGRTVATVDAETATPQSLATLMVGREIEVGPPLEQGRQLADVRTLEVDGLTVSGDRGETAVETSRSHPRGRDRRRRWCRRQRAARAGRGALGDARHPSGSVRVGGDRLRGGDPREAILAGVAHVPEDRLGTGLAPSLSVT